MSLQQLEQPPPYSSNSQIPQTLHLPSPPTTTPSQNSNSTQITLPSIKDHQSPPLPFQASRRLPTPNPTHQRSSHDLLLSSHDSNASVDDRDDRTAAEALLGLRKVDHQRSPSGYETPLEYYPIGIEHTRSASQNQDAEPLLSLLTSSHPWLGGTVKGSLSAYSSTKSYTPRFVQAGADIVENTVGTVGRKAGVEDSIRRYLGSRRTSEVDPSSLENTTASKERAVLSTIADLERKVSNPTESRRSMDSLPAYDDHTSPAYEEGNSKIQTRPVVNRSWSAQLIISTSGLGAALNESSLHSLKLCLSILGNANKHVIHLINSLKNLLSQFDHSSRNLEAGADTPMLDADSMPADRIAHRIRELNHEVWETLKHVVNVVSRYTGGALPENASVVVRWQLLSVPRRWQRAVSQSTTAGTDGASAHSDTKTSATRMIAFAAEGLDMIGQVGGVVDSTIMSAERWLDSMGRRRHEAGEAAPVEKETFQSA